MAPEPSLPYSRDVSLTPLPAFPSVPAQPMTSPFTSQSAGAPPPQQSMGAYGHNFATGATPASNGVMAAQPQVGRASPMPAYNGGAANASPFWPQNAGQDFRASAGTLSGAQPWSSYAGTYAHLGTAAPPRPPVPQNGSVYAPSARVYPPAVPPSATNNTSHAAHPQSHTFLQPAPRDEALPATGAAVAPPLQPQSASPFAALASARPAAAQAQPQLQAQQRVSDPPAPGTQADVPAPRSHGSSARHAAPRNGESNGVHAQSDATPHVKPGSGESGSWHEDSEAASDHHDTDDHDSPRAGNAGEEVDAIGKQQAGDEVEAGAGQRPRVRTRAARRLCLRRSA